MGNLATYRQRRDFDKTPEPRGEAARKAGRSFVVQKHAARRLHYDFRLELDGVLLSWAVPKGPSLDPSVKRLAQQTEDHPLEYGGFEGTIPAGEYGAGTVMLWDRGTWIPEGDPRKQYREGRLTFELRGERLSGRWHLVRTARDGGKSWLLFKSKDDRAQHDGDALLRSATTSVASRRTMEEIAAGVPRRAARRASARPAKKRETTRTASVRIPEPELATLVDRVPEGDDWLHEVKLDGYRILARVVDGAVTLTTRNGHDWTSRLPALRDAVSALPVRSALLDGELVALDENGVSNFQKLQNALQSPEKASLAYCAFDLLHLDGHDVRPLPLHQRKELLATLLGGGKRRQVRAPRRLAQRGPILRYSEHVRGRGAEFFRQACALGLEGVVSKRADAAYRSGRSRDWLKTKCTAQQEFVIGGFTEPSGARHHLGALLVGLWKDGQLVYSGKVGTGFTERSLAELHEKLAPLERSRSPFVEVPREVQRGVHWVEPRLVAEIAFTEMTGAHRLRHPTFRGLREDKPAKSVRPERPASATPERALPALTNADKVLYPDAGITKRDLADYYLTVAEHMLPHVVDRPLMLARCPNGQGKPCFFQKHLSRGRPEALRAVTIREKSGSDEYLTLHDTAGLVALVQLGALEIHTWGSRARRVERPDLMVLDLDPDPELPWGRVVEAALLVRRLFHELDLEAYAKTTGGKGLHVCVPIAPRNDWDTVKSFTQDVAETLVRLAPDRYLATQSKAKRKGKIFVDYLRNGRGATFIAPYSTRARPGAPVAAPIAWEELERGRRPAFDVKTVPKRLHAAEREPWPGFHTTRQGLTAAKIRSVAGAARKL